MKPGCSKQLVLLALLVLSASGSMAAPFGTAFTYCQGGSRLEENVSNGLYDFRFSLWDAAGSGATLIGTTQTVSNVSISNGLFTVSLDFGPGAFAGDGRWLELGVRTNGAATFGVLNPRQPLTPIPYAIAASNLSGTLAAGQLTGTLPARSPFGNVRQRGDFEQSREYFCGQWHGVDQRKRFDAGRLWLL